MNRLIHVYTVRIINTNILKIWNIHNFVFNLNMFLYFFMMYNILLLLHWLNTYLHVVPQVPVLGPIAFQVFEYQKTLLVVFDQGLPCIQIADCFLWSTAVGVLYYAFIGPCFCFCSSHFSQSPQATYSSFTDRLMHTVLKNGNSWLE